MSVVHRQRTRARQLLMVALISLLGLSAGLALYKNAAGRHAALPKVIIAVPAQIAAGALYVAQYEKLFERQGVEVTVQPFSLGKQALQSMLQGHADLAVVADLPFMFAVLHGDRIAALSTLFGARKAIGLVARRDRGIHRPEDLAGKTIGTLFGTNTQFFLDALLLAHGVPRSSVTIIDVPPEGLAAALRSGRVDAVTVWKPALDSLERASGGRVVTFYAEDDFVSRFMLTGRPAWIVRHPAAVRGVLAAVAEGTRFIQQQPAQAAAVIGRAINQQPLLVAQSFNPNNFNMALDQTLLLALDDETRWAIKRGLVPRGALPNFLDYVQQQPLASVLPGAVRIIH